MQWILGLLHGTDYLVAHLLLGSLIFYSWILSAGGEDAQVLECKKALLLRRLAVVTLVTSVLWMIVSISDMTESWLPQDLWAGISQTTFGHLWLVRIGVLLLLSFSVGPLLNTSLGRKILLLLAVTVPLVSGFTGHASAQKSFIFWRESLVISHSLSVAVWTGGLFRLHQWLGIRLRLRTVRPEMSHSVVKRFSQFAMASTGAIGITGIAMAYLAGVSPSHPLSTAYGRLVFLKLALFGLALGAAALNQFFHLRNWNPSQELQFSRVIRREIRIELALVTGAFLIAGFLARTSM
ncbi:MAG: CopD family protein [Cryobacterium sp.]|nr:CopD family protein [Oligoflexia bacterium]